jgi:hypothetical protein
LSGEIARGALRELSEKRYRAAFALVGGVVRAGRAAVVGAVETSGVVVDFGDVEGDVPKLNAGGEVVVVAPPVPPTTNWLGSIV